MTWQRPSNSAHFTGWALIISIWILNMQSGNSILCQKRDTVQLWCATAGRSQFTSATILIGHLKDFKLINWLCKLLIGLYLRKRWSLFIEGWRDQVYARLMQVKVMDSITSFLLPLPSSSPHSCVGTGLCFINGEVAGYMATCIINVV